MEGRLHGRPGLQAGELDAGWAEELDEAAWPLCVHGEGDPRCSTAAAYRGHEASP